jgi:general secretion pathway protein J
MSTARRARGHSLIELLVALVIFATMAAIAYAGLSAVTRSRATLDERERQLAELGRSLAAIERDLRSVARRSVRAADGRSLPMLMSEGEALELSSHGRGRAAGADLGLIERVGWLRDGEGVKRLRWPTLDRAEGSRPDLRPMLADATALRWRFLDAQGRWLRQWPPQGDAGQALPRAVEFALVHPALGEVLRVVELPDAGPAVPR